MFLVLTMLAVFAFAISSKTDDKRWIELMAIALFSGGLFASYKVKITVQREGFEIKNLRGTKFIAWSDITALQLDMAYHGHGVQEQLTVTTRGKTYFLHPKQFQAKPMRRFFEVLNEQCDYAIKNIHFLRQATGK